MRLTVRHVCFAFGVFLAQAATAFALDPSPIAQSAIPKDFAAKLEPIGNLPMATGATSQALVQSVLPPMELADISTRLGVIDSSLAKLKEKGEKPDYQVAIIGLTGSLVGILLGGIITFLIQRTLFKHQRTLATDAATQARDLAQARAGFEIGNSLVQWKLKQLSDLYGPLRALLMQSNVMYRHMNDVLIRADPALYRFREGSPEEDFDSQVFEIKLNGEWTRFRTVLHLSEVYGRAYGIEEYFDEVVDVGRRIAEVIEQKAGYARPDQPGLPRVFGKYLAHFSVLRRLHAVAQAKHYGKTKIAPAGKLRAVGASQTIVVVESAVFPNEIRGLVDKDFEALNREVSEWGAKAGA